MAADTADSPSLAKPAPASAAAGGSAAPLSRLEWMIALRYLRPRRGEGVISVIAAFSLIGIMLGVATLIIVMSVMNGFRVELIDRILGAQPHITVQPYEARRLEGAEAIDERLQLIPGIMRSAPVIERQVLASGPSGSTGVLVRGLSPTDLRTLEGVADPEQAAGSLDDFGVDVGGPGGQGIAIGSGVARQLGLRLGDRIRLVSPDGIQTPFGVTPRTKAYRIAYIFQIGSAQYDNAFVFMPLEEARAYFSMPDRVDHIEVMVADPDDLEPYGGAILQAVGETAPGCCYLWNWKRANGAFIAALDVERRVMFIILSLIILVAALNIIAGLTMLVKDKGRDIAILRTMGLTRAAILRVFFLCGGAIGFTGTLLGVGLGILFTLNITEIQAAVEAVYGGEVWDPQIRMLTEVPAVMVPSDVIMTTVIALVLTFIATWIPARRAARLDPVAGLRDG
ncbi:MAG: lipoprotein-releasing ABC transporter permease subunit [Pseudomonadota bacterium]